MDPSGSQVPINSKRFISLKITFNGEIHTSQDIDWTFLSVFHHSLLSKPILEGLFIWSRGNMTLVISVLLTNLHQQSSR